MHALFLIAALQQALPAAPTVMPGPIADTREPRTAIGFIVTDLFADALIARDGQGLPATEDARRDTHGVVQLGTNFPLVRFGGVVVSLQGGLHARFRLEAQDNDALSSDFLVALPVNFTTSGFDGRVRFIHRSSHLGDELVQNTSIRRLEYDHEEIDGLLARRVGPIRVYGGGTLTVASSFDSDRWGVQFGADGQWPAGERFAVRGGVDFQHHSIGAGDSRISALIGFVLRGPVGQISLDGVAGSGSSATGEFFLERERYWGLQVTLRRLNED